MLPGKHWITTCDRNYLRWWKSQLHVWPCLVLLLHHCSRFKNWFRFWNPVVWARPQTGSPQDYSFKELFVIQCFRWVTELWNQPHTHHRWSDHSTGQMTVISFKKHIPDASEQLIDSRITQIAPRSSRFCPLSVVRSLILWPQVELQRSLYCLEQLFKLNIFHRSHRFTPDFTSSRVIRELKLVTCGGSEFVFVLNASLPYHMLAACAESLPRPSWELELYIIVSLIMRWVSLQNRCCSIKRAPPQLTAELAVSVSPQFYVPVGDCHGLPGGSEHMGAFQETCVGGIQLQLGDWETV